MNILLFYPPITIRGKDTTTPGAAPPLGLANIAAYLEVNGYHVSIVDALAEGINIVKKAKNSTRIGLSPKQLIRKLNYFHPDIVGISTMFTAFAKDAHDLAKMVKKTCPNTLVVFGGAHSSILYEDDLKDKAVDLVVIGEGEITFLEIIQKFENHQSLTTILGTATKDHRSHLIKNPPRPPISNLDSLPMPGRHLLPMDIYLKYNQDNQDSYIMRSPSTTIVTSRGCPNNCIYCAVPGIWGRSWRPLSAKRVLDEIEFLTQRYGIREIHFLDDNIAVSRKRLEDICDGLIQRKINIKWTCPNGITVWTLDRPLLLKMKKSGCYRLTFGIESGSPTTQKFIRKNLNLKKAKKIMKIASEIGLWTFSTYIIGFPYESKTDILSTFSYAIESFSDFVVFILLMPFPKTDVTAIMLREKIITSNQLTYSKIGELFSGYQGTGNLNISISDLKSLQNHANAKLMISRLFRPITHPLLFAKKIQSFEDFKYLLKIISRYATMLFSTIKFGELKTHRLRQAKYYQILQPVKKIT